MKVAGTFNPWNFFLKVTSGFLLVVFPPKSKDHIGRLSHQCNCHVLFSVTLLFKAQRKVYMQLKIFFQMVAGIK